jgi:ABC-type proline/glycine betaine transport system permease subunit
MFGPLNGVRTALVVAAGIAAIASFIVGAPIAGVVLLTAVLAHGLGWLYLYGQRPRP